MRTITVLVALIPVMAYGQTKPGGSRQGSGGAGSQQIGALGGVYAGQGSSRPLGGIAPPYFPGVGGPVPARTARPESRYSGPVYYVPNAFGPTFGSDVESAENPYAPPPSRSSVVQFSDAAPQPPVIVNQYYGRDQAPLNSMRSGAPIPPDPSLTRDYYLIAYKNRHVITAEAYWVDAQTLHYVTANNVQNQASLSLIDLDMTIRLNADREVPFSVAGK